MTTFATTPAAQENPSVDNGMASTGSATRSGTEVLLAVRQGTSLRVTDTGLRVDTPTWGNDIPLPDRVVRQRLADVMGEPISVTALTVACAREGNLTSAMTVRGILTKLCGVGVFDHVLVADGVEVARATGEGNLPVVAGTGEPPPVPRLAPWAVITAATRTGRVGDASPEIAVVQSGVSHVKVELSPGVLTHLLAVRADDVPKAVLQMLDAAKLLEPVVAESGLERWSPVDLWIHRLTAESRSVDRYGGTYPAGQDDPPTFARQIGPDAVTVDLPTPDLQRLRSEDPSLAAVVEDRRSTRSFSETEFPSLAQLGELLFRTCRVRRSFVDTSGLEVVDRPFPAGGSIHELEVYLAVARADGLEPGLWRYAADRHQLVRVAEADAPGVRRTLEEARNTGGAPQSPPIVVAVRGRFDRLMFKYETIAYALALKNTGVLMQTFYLNATAMGLGVCALGGGSTAALGSATGISGWDEGTLGLLMLGVP